MEFYVVTHSSCSPPLLCALGILHNLYYVIFYGFCLSIVCPYHPHTDMQSTDSLILFDCKYLISLYEHPEPHSCIIYLYYAAVAYVGVDIYRVLYIFIVSSLPCLLTFWRAISTHFSYFFLCYNTCMHLAHCYLVSIHRSVCPPLYTSVQLEGAVFFPST